MSGVNVSQQIDQLVDRFKMAMDKRARDGLGVAGRSLFTHEVPRNEYGKRIGKLRVRDDKRRFIADLADLLLAGVPFLKLPDALLKRGHVNHDGRAYRWSTIHRLLYNPYFYGNSARHYNAQGKVIKGEWAFDASAPPPAGVTVYYGTHESAYEGELLRRVTAELKRRAGLTGRASPYRSHRFSTLLRCDECGRPLAFDLTRRRDKAYPRYVCKGHNHGACGQFRAIREHDAQTTIDALLRAVIGLPDALAVLLGAPQDTPIAFTTQTVEREVAAVETQIRQLIYSESNAPENVRSLYSEQIQAASARLKALHNQLNELERGKSSARRLEERARLLDDVLRDLEAFWARDDRAVNQALHAIFGGHRFMVRDGRIVALDDRG